MMWNIGVQLALFSPLLLILCQQVSGLTCPANEDAPWSSRLRSKLFCNYDRYSRPGLERKNNVTVNVSLDIKYLSMDEHSSQMMIHSWVATEWLDQALVWDPSQYDGLTRLVVPSDDIWQPDLSIYNSDLTQIMLFSSTSCVLYNSGRLECGPDLRTPILCNQDLRRWPFDTQGCSLYIGSWAHRGEDIDVQLQNGKGFRKYGYEESNSWHLENITGERVVGSFCCPNFTLSFLHYKFVLKRHAALYAASIVVPAFVLAGLALLSLLVKGYACRVCICCTALLGDALFLQYIGFHLPASGDTSPDIVAYFRDAMILDVICLMLGLIAESLKDSGLGTVVAPQWLTGAAGWLKGRGGRAGQLLLGNTEPFDTDQDPEGPPPAVRDSESAGNPRWSLYATLLERFSLLALTIVRVVFLVALLP